MGGTLPPGDRRREADGPHGVRRPPGPRERRRRHRRRRDARRPVLDRRRADDGRQQPRLQRVRSARRHRGRRLPVHRLGDRTRDGQPDARPPHRRRLGGPRLREPRLPTGRGTWNNCFGTVSPWNTPLSSEEYEPDAKAWFEPDEQTYGNREATMADYLGYFGNAYRYGYVVEITEPFAESPTPEKRFAMGRFSHENAVVMPDNKTVYMSDDGTGVVLGKFVADRARDLSSGTLYAASLTQDDGTDPASVGFDVEWVELGHATDAEVESWVAEYDGQDPSDDYDPDYITDEEVEAWANGNNPYDDQRIPFLETRKAAGALGATDEFRKMEGVNVRPNAHVGDYVYVAMSEINESMLANEDAPESDPEDDIRLERNDYGALYRMPIEGGFDVRRIEPAVVGSEDSFWQLDNVVVMDDGRVIVGEDSDHETNQLWVYDPADN
ncbi:alkaline phosphatase PhoX [Halobacteriaceae archaeon GCM10025711]